MTYTDGLETTAVLIQTTAKDTANGSSPEVRPKVRGMRHIRHRCPSGRESAIGTVGSQSGREDAMAGCGWAAGNCCL